MIASLLDEFHTHPNARGTRTNSLELRPALHEEEHKELMDELTAGFPVKLGLVARELADVVYVCYGTAWVHGIDLDAAVQEVHRAAMDKMRAGIKREDGKIVKPPGFLPPDMTRAIR